MAKGFLPYSLDQHLLLPPDMRGWLAEGHLALFVSDVVDQLDLSEIFATYLKDETRGRAGYHPQMMVKILLYGYATGVTSSRKLERKTTEDVAFRVLSGDQQPDHDSIASFRKRHLGQLGGLFLQVLVLCQKAGLVKLGHIAIDGTKMGANASKHKAMSYGRMSDAEKKLEDEVKALLKEAGRALYKMRKPIVEPVFGQLKAARGLRRFAMRGLGYALAEFLFIALTHNLLKMFRFAPRLENAA